MSDTKRTVVIEMSDDAYRAIAEEASIGGMTVGELLINHTFAQMLNALADEGNHLRWQMLYALWRKHEPNRAPQNLMAEVFPAVGTPATE